MDPNIAKPEIQELPSGQGTGEKAKQDIEDQIFQASMGNRWTEVQQLYINNEFVHESKLTKSEDTALHLAISSYHPDRYDSLQHPHLTCIKEMIDKIPKEPKENRQRILKQKNAEGNTPLHLAAELGIVPIIECLVNPEDPTLIWETNSEGETPLFITAYLGVQEAFLYLHKCVQYENGEGPTELCRREDGDNILHAAISGEYFELAFQIIHYYPLLVNHYNTKGMSPLHFLSRMPQVFKSGSHFRFIDSIIYYCINIDELELMTYEAERIDSLKLKLSRNLPENYQTLVEFLVLLWYGTQKIRDYIIGVCTRNRENKSKDTTGVTDANQEKKAPGHQNDPKNPPTQAEGKRKGQLFPANFAIFIKFLKCLMKIVLSVLGIDYIIGVCTGNRENKSQDPTNVNQDKMSQGHQSDRQYDPENPTIKDITGATNDNQENKSPDITGATNENQEKKPPAEGESNKLFPPNYTIFIEFLKCLMKIVLIVLGIGLQRIKKLEETKKKNKRGVQIMELMIKKEERYKYNKSTGEKPEDRDHHSQVPAPPTKPPPIVEDDDKEDEDQSKIAPTKQSPTSSTDEKKKDDPKSGKESFLLFR
ncbi:uncharacterized protein LOC132601950 [Lycium barbarum]|uniref:uncharacterized protein LOC132601950 n=1 Tax=Lycium barbarum TaxID=112863 RepID=UPI00293E023E|nr:uncharacterized protein LOC132601950 [Lycium barbarum]